MHKHIAPVALASALHASPRAYNMTTKQRVNQRHAKPRCDKVEYSVLCVSSLLCPVPIDLMLKDLMLWSKKVPTLDIVGVILYS